MSRVLVTGAGGFIGSRLCDYLVARGHDIVGTWREDKSRLGPLESAGVALRQVDLADRTAVERLFEDGPFDTIVHAAGWIGRGETGGDRWRAHEDNIEASGNLATAAVHARACHRYVYCSTIAVYGGQSAPVGGLVESQVAPNSDYGWSKRFGERTMEYAAAMDDECVAVALRLAGVHGKGRTTGALHALTSAVLHGRPMEVTDPESQFRWLFIDDLLVAVETLLRADLPKGHHICNLASEDIFTLRELAERIRRHVGGRVASKIPILETGDRRRVEVMNIDFARSLFGFVPTSLDDFLPRYIEHVATSG